MEVANSLDYSKKVKSAPVYRFARRAPTDQTDISVSPSGGVYRDIKLPSSLEYYNLSRSVLSYLQTPAAAGAAYIDMFADCLSAIRSIEFSDELSGSPITTVNNVNYFTKLVHYCCTKYEDFLNKPVAYSKLTTAIDMTTMLQRCSVSNVAVSMTNAATVNLTTASIGASALAITQSTIPSILQPEHILRADGGSVQDWIRNPMELFLGSNATANPQIRVNVRLGESLKETLFSVDKILPLPSCNLRINFSTSPEIMVDNTADGTAGTFSVTTGNVTISQLYLYVAYNKDRQVNDQLRAEVNSPSGLNVVFPVVRSDLRNLTLPVAANNVNISVQYGPQDGQTLVRVYMVPYTAVKTGGQANMVYSHTNMTTLTDAAHGVRISSFHTQLNSQRIQDIDMNCVKSEEYLYLRHLLEDSMILSARQYSLNWFWCDDWSSNGKLVDSQLDSVIQGLPTAGGLEWSFVGIVNGVTTYYTSGDFRIFSVLQKQMNISAQGVLVR